jgi:WD40 repeat protein
LHVWDVASGKRIATLATGTINYVAFSPEGRWLATNSGVQFPGERLKVWDVRSGTQAADFSFEKGGTPVSWISFAKSNGSPLTATGTFTRAWQFTANDGTHTVWSGSSPLAISPDGKLLITQSGLGGNLDVWDMTSGQKLTSIAAHKLSISSLAFSGDGRWLVTGGYETQVSRRDGTSEWRTRVWDTATWNERMSLAFLTTGGRCAAFSPDGHLLATEKSSEAVDLVQVEGGIPLATLKGTDPQPERHQFTPENVAFSPDGSLLAQGAQNGIRIWKVPR